MLGGEAFVDVSEDVARYTSMLEEAVPIDPMLPHWPQRQARHVADCFLELVSPANEADAPNLAPAAEQARSLAPATKARDARLRRGSAAPSMADLMDAKVTPTKAKIKQKRRDFDEAQDAENASMAGSRNGADRERRKNVFGDKKKRRGDLTLLSLIHI